jgi:hypothetical protein
MRPQNANGVHITFPNGVTVSCIWGPGSYTENRDALLSQPRDNVESLIGWWNRPLEADTVEVAMWRADGEWIMHEYTGDEQDEGEPLAQRTSSELQAILDWASKVQP